VIFEVGDQVLSGTNLDAFGYLASRFDDPDNLVQNTAIDRLRHG
jgi:hypothetical protein